MQVAAQLQDHRHLKLTEEGLFLHTPFGELSDVQGGAVKVPE
jgi:hypothetical protein